MWHKWLIYMRRFVTAFWTVMRSRVVRNVRTVTVVAIMRLDFWSTMVTVMGNVYFRFRFIFLWNMWFMWTVW